MKLHVCSAVLFATSTFGVSALAQPAPATGDASAAVGLGSPGSVTAEATPAAPAEAAPTAAPAAAVAPQPEVGKAPAPAAAEAGSDHEAVVGRLAVGYLGYVNIPYGEMGSANANFSPLAASAPVIGIRYWLSSGMGIDAGLGFATTFGTHKSSATGAPTTSTNATAPTGLAVHFGVPLALKSAKHYSFQIIPEANFGYAQQALSDTANNVSTDLTGMHFDIGARAGAEIHFGFIGVPELSLVGSVGLRLDVHKTKTERQNNNNSTSTTLEDSRTLIGTTVNNKPWDIFLGNVSALYYL